MQQCLKFGMKNNLLDDFKTLREILGDSSEEMKNKDVRDINFQLNKINNKILHIPICRWLKLFKFTFLGIEFSRNKERKITERMEASKMSRHKLTKQQKRFQKCVRKAHYNIFAPRSFGSFMHACLKGRR